VTTKLNLGAGVDVIVGDDVTAGKGRAVPVGSRVAVAVDTSGDIPDGVRAHALNRKTNARTIKLILFIA
jgi:hypothetical protein